jgi:hypothetical protein
VRKTWPWAVAGTFIVGICFAGCATVGGVFGIRSGYEAPEYSVINTLDSGIEIREYKTRVAAEATVETSDNRNDENQAFRYLFGYISGKNEGEQKIAMTVPVSTNAESEGDSKGDKIAMTVPVETNRPTTNTMTMRFFLPGKYTIETAPPPTDERVTLVELPPQTMAVRKLKGGWSEAELHDQKQVLLNDLADTLYETTDDPVIYYYDPPFTLPFRRLQEVAVPVTQKE